MLFLDKANQKFDSITERRLFFVQKKALLNLDIIKNARTLQKGLAREGLWYTDAWRERLWFMLEICAFHLQDFHTAVASGADRLEVCVEYEHGGLTPPSEWIRVLHETYPHIPLVSMARPRGGDFCYSDKEWDQLSADAVELRDAGSAAIVFGCLTADHKLDIPRCQQLITHLKCPCVLHRAFDEIEDPLR